LFARWSAGARGATFASNAGTRRCRRCLAIVAAVIPCRSLYASWISRRRSVSEIAAPLERVSLSENTGQRFSTCRGPARSSDQRGSRAGIPPCRRRGIATTETPGGRGLAKQGLTPRARLAQTQVGGLLDALERVDLARADSGSGSPSRRRYVREVLDIFFVAS